MNEAPMRPAPGPPRPYSFPDFTRRELANGVTLLVAPVRRLPICALSVLVDAGAELDPPGEEGRALLTARALAEGTTRFPGIAFTEELERIGAALDASADWDGAHLTLAVMAARFPRALELLADVLQNPAFPSAEIDRLREERLSEIVQLRAEPRGLANEIFARVIYTRDSRYSIPLGGREESVRAIDREAVVQHHASFVVPRRTTVIVAGDVNADDVLRVVEQTLGGWKNEGSEAKPRHGRENLERSPLNIAHREGAPQSELRVGHAGVPRFHPDHFPITLMNAVLGGLFSSRINLNLREEHAYTYGAHSGFDWRRGAGPFAVRTAVESGVTGGAVSEILKEIRRLRDEPVTAAELSLAQNYLAGVFPVRFETSLAIAAALAQMVTYGLPADFYDSYRDNVQRVTVADIQRVAMEQLSPERLTVVAVGNAAQAREQLESLGIGAVTELSVEETAAAPVPTAVQQQSGGVS